MENQTPDDRLALLPLTAPMRDEVLGMMQEYAAAGEDRYDDALAQARADFARYVERLAEIERGVGLEPGHVPQSTYWLVRGDGRVIGASRLRHALSPALEDWGGHIGYDVRPAERRKGYGTRLLALMLDKAKARGLRRVLLTCDKANVHSARIIERNGGRLASESPSPRAPMVQRYWIELG